MTHNRQRRAALVLIAATLITATLGADSAIMVTANNNTGNYTAVSATQAQIVAISQKAMRNTPNANVGIVEARAVSRTEIQMTEPANPLGHDNGTVSPQAAYTAAKTRKTIIDMPEPKAGNMWPRAPRQAQTLATTDNTLIKVPLPYTDDEIIMLAKTVWGEARGCTDDEQRLVIWTILQRVNDARFPGTIAEVITARKQFSGYHAANPTDEDILALCRREVHEWSHGAEPPTYEPFAPTTPYLFFDGDGHHNWFREGWR